MTIIQRHKCCSNYTLGGFQERRLSCRGGDIGKIVTQAILQCRVYSTSLGHIYFHVLSKFNSGAVLLQCNTLLQFTNTLKQPSQPAQSPNGIKFYKINVIFSVKKRKHSKFKTNIFLLCDKLHVHVFCLFFFCFFYISTCIPFLTKTTLRGMGIPKQGIVSNTLANLAMGNSTLMLMLGDFWRGSFGLKIWL